MGRKDTRAPFFVLLSDSINRPPNARHERERERGRRWWERDGRFPRPRLSAAEPARHGTQLQATHLDTPGKEKEKKENWPRATKGPNAHLLSVNAPRKHKLNAPHDRLAYPFPRAIRLLYSCELFAPYRHPGKREEMARLRRESREPAAQIHIPRGDTGREERPARRSACRG